MESPHTGARRRSAMPLAVALALVAALALSAPFQRAVAEPTADDPPSDPLLFGVVPQQAAAKSARLWGPLLLELERRSGVALRFATAPDIPTFERRLLAGEYDIAYMNPYHYTVFSRRPGYRALAKARDKRIRGIVVVPVESPHTTPESLAGSTLAFPSPAAFAASILTQAEFRRRGVAIEAAYVRSHDSVYRSVAKGLFPAGGGVLRTFNGVAPEVRERLRVLWQTDPYTPHAIAAHPRVASQRLDRLLAAMTTLADDPVGRGLLQPLALKGLEPAADGDWDDVRALGIDLLEPLLEE